MIYDFMQMPRCEILDIFVDLHDQKVDLSHEIIELKMSIERLVHENDRLEERVKAYRDEQKARVLRHRTLDA